MSRTLRRVTGVCGAALMMLPLTAGITQVRPVNANAKARTHKTAKRRARKGGIEIKTPKKINDSQVLHDRILANAKETMPKVDFSHANAKNTKPLTSAQDRSLGLDVPTAKAKYLPASTFNSVANNSAINNSTKEAVMKLEAMPAGFKPKSGTLTFGNANGTENTYDALTGKSEATNPGQSASAPSGSVNIDQFKPSSANSFSAKAYQSSKVASSATSAQSTENQHNSEQVGNEIQSNVNSAATDFANVAKNAPIKKSAVNSLTSKFAANPSGAAKALAKSVNNISAGKVNNDKKFQSAINNVSPMKSTATSVAYSANPKKAAKKFGSVSAKVSRDATDAAKSGQAPVAFTSNKLTADQSKMLVNDQQAMNNLAHGITKTHAHKVSNTKQNNFVVKLTNAQPSLEKTPEMLNGTAPLQSGPSNGKTVLNIGQIQHANEEPNYSNTYMIFQQAKLRNGSVMDHVVSYSGHHIGWVPDSSVQAGANPKEVATPKGIFHFSNPSKDATYELPLGSSWADPYIMNRTDAVGRDNLHVTAARRAVKKGKPVTSYYVKDYAHPYIDGWVTPNELSRRFARKASSKKANTPKINRDHVTRFAVDVEGNFSQGPIASNGKQAGSDNLDLPRVFSNTQVQALRGNKKQGIDWKVMNRRFFNVGHNMHSFSGTATYYRQNGHVIYVPKSDIKAAKASGKVLFHYNYTIDKRATRRANKHAKNGDIVNVYYRRSEAKGIAGAVNNKKPVNGKVVAKNGTQKPNQTNKQVKKPAAK